MDFEKEYNVEFQDYRDMDIFEEMKEFCARKLAQQKAMLTAEIEEMRDRGWIRGTDKQFDNVLKKIQDL